MNFGIFIVIISNLWYNSINFIWRKAMDFAKVIAEEFKIKELHAQNTVNLLEDDNTVPFIARYRKEMTGGLDDQVIREISERLNYLKNLVKRKEEVLSSIEEQGKLTKKFKRPFRTREEWKFDIKDYE